MTDAQNLGEIDFAELANALNNPAKESLRDLFRTAHGSGDAESSGEPERKVNVRHTARSALLHMPDDLDRYDAVMQAAVEGKTLVTRDAHHFDTTGSLRVWLTWLEVHDDTPRTPEAKT